MVLTEQRRCESSSLRVTREAESMSKEGTVEPGFPACSQKDNNKYTTMMHKMVATQLT